MNKGFVYQNNAKKYIDAGLSVIPLRGYDKVPMVKSWSDFCHALPPKDLVSRWLNISEPANMGLCCGKASGFIALDIDTDDPTLINIIMSLVPPTPYERIGKKGKVLGFKWNGERPFKITNPNKNADNGTICELLSTGNQMCLEGSIHPQTKQPYKSSFPLYQVIKNLPTLPSDFEKRLKEKLEHATGISFSTTKRMRITDFVNVGGRDNAMTSFAGILAMSVLRGENTLKEAVGMMHEWFKNNVQSVPGDDIKVENGISNLVTFLFRHVDRDNKTLPIGWDNGLTEEDKKALNIGERSEQTAMSEDQIREAIKENFSKTSENSEERNAFITYILRKMSGSDLGVLSQERLLAFITSNDKTMSIGALRKTLREISKVGIEGVNHSEIANAVLRDINEMRQSAKDAFGGESNNIGTTYPYVRCWNDTLYEYNGCYWQEMTKGRIMKHIAENYGFLPAAKKNSDLKGIFDLIKTLVEGDVCEELIRTEGLNMSNGYVTERGEIFPHDKKYGATYMLPYAYKPELADLHDAPLFTTFLHNCWSMEPDYEERVKCLQEAIAATLFGIAPEYSRAVLLFGIGGSGKSQMLKIIESLLPPEAVSYVKPYAFNDKFGVTDLCNSLLNIAGELSETCSIPGDVFKSIVSGEKQVGQYKCRPLFTFKPRAAHWFASNHLPKTRDVTSGFFRRWMVFSFNHVINPKDRIINIGEMIAERERESIVAWSMKALERLRVNKEYSLPPSHFDNVISMAEESDSVFYWLSAGLQSSPKKGSMSKLGETDGDRINIQELYERYSSSCFSELSQKPVGQRKFFGRLRELSLTSKQFRIDGNWVDGLTYDSAKGERLNVGGL